MNNDNLERKFSINKRKKKKKKEKEETKSKKKKDWKIKVSIRKIKREVQINEYITMLTMEINITIILRREYISEKKKYCYVFIRKEERTNHFDLNFNAT